MSPKLLLLKSVIEKNQTKLFWISFSLVLVYSFLVRAFHAKTGLPYIHGIDEPKIASNALQMLKTGDMNPHYYNYGTLPMYINFFVDIFHYLYLMGKPDNAEAYLRNLDDIKTYWDTGWHWSASHPTFYHWNRLVTAGFGFGTVVFTFLVARNVLSSKWLALLAAAFLAAQGYHISHSAYVTTDVPVAFFVMGSIYFSLVFYDKGLTKHLVFALVFCGLSAATKYNSALAVLLPSLIVGIRYFKARDLFKTYWLAMIPLVPMASFLIAMPYAFIDSVQFLKGIGYEVYHYKVRGHGGKESTPGLEHITFQLNMFYQRLGGFAAALTVLGLLGCLYRPKLTLALLTPMLFSLYMTTQMSVNFHRNFIQVYPAVAILFASSAIVLQKTLTWFSRGKSANLAQPVGWVISGVLTFYMLSVGQASWIKAVAAKERIENRSQAIQYLNSQNFSNVIFAEELRMHQQDLRKLDAEYRVMKLKDILTLDRSQGVYVVLPVNPMTKMTGERAKPKLTAQRALSSLLASIPENDVLKRIGGDRKLDLDQRSINPGLVVVKLSPTSAFPPPEGEIPLSHMTFSKEFVIQRGNLIKMQSNGMITLPVYRLSKGSHDFRVQLRGSQAYGENAKLILTIEDAGNEKTLLSRQIEAKETYSIEEVPIKLSQATKVQISLAYVNDANDKENRQDRNAYIKSVSLQQTMASNNDA
ncbi:MAG: phospholipid carrier-dependent glycosyltransferase [Cyanobacteria bacterium P01_F01_bin.86]